MYQNEYIVLLHECINPCIVRVSNTTGLEPRGVFIMGKSTKGINEMKAKMDCIDLLRGSVYCFRFVNDGVIAWTVEGMLIRDNADESMFTYDLGTYKTESGALKLCEAVANDYDLSNEGFLIDMEFGDDELEDLLQEPEAVEYTPTPDEIEAASHIQGDAYLVIDDQLHSLLSDKGFNNHLHDVLAQVKESKVVESDAPKEQYAVWDSWADHTKLYTWDELLDLLSVESGFNYDVNGISLDTLSIALEDYHLFVTPVGVFPYDAENAGADVELIDTYVEVKVEGCHVQSYIYVDDVLRVYDYGVMSLDCAVSLQNRLSTFTHVGTEKLLQDDLVHVYRLCQKGAKEICVLQDQLDNDNRMIVSAHDAEVMANRYEKKEPMEQWEAVEILEANDYAVTCISIQSGWN